MKVWRSLLLVIVVIVVLSGCKTEESTGLFVSDFDRALDKMCPFTIEKAEISMVGKENKMPYLEIRGEYPRQCGQIQVAIERPNQKSQIHVTLHATKESDTSDELKPFFLNVAMANLWNGKFSVWINGKPATELILQ